MICRPGAVASALATLALVACSGPPAAITLAPLDSSAVKATAHLQEVYGKGGKVITARMEVADPAHRELVAALVKGRCAKVEAFVDTLQMLDVPGHLRAGAPTRLSALKGTHAVALFPAATFTEEQPGTPIACADL